MAPGTEGDTGHVGTVPWCVGISSLWPEDPAPLVKDHKEGARCPEMVRTRARPGVLSPASPWLCLCRSTLPYALQIQLIWQVLLCANDMGACPGSRLGHLLPSRSAGQPPPPGVSGGGPAQKFWENRHPQRCSGRRHLKEAEGLQV